MSTGQLILYGIVGGIVFANLFLVILMWVYTARSNRQARRQERPED